MDSTAYVHYLGGISSFLNYIIIEELHTFPNYTVRWLSIFVRVQNSLTFVQLFLKRNYLNCYHFLEYKIVLRSFTPAVVVAAAFVRLSAERLMLFSYHLHFVVAAVAVGL